MFVKINNLYTIDGIADYKSLDISKIKAGTQLYPDYDNVAYFEYEGEVVEGGDVQIVTQSTYNEHKNRIKNAPKPISPEQRLADLEAIIEMAMMEGKL